MPEIDTITQQTDWTQPDLGAWVVTFSCGCTEILWEPYLPDKSQEEQQQDLQDFAQDLATAHECGVFPTYIWSSEFGLCIRNDG